MFRNAFAFVVIASALAMTGCSKCSEQPAAEAPAATEAPAEAAPAATEAPAEAAPAEAAPAAEATPAAH